MSLKVASLMVIIALPIFLAACLLYKPSVHFPLLYDDTATVIRNGLVVNGTVSGLMQSPCLGYTFDSEGEGSWLKGIAPYFMYDFWGRCACLDSSHKSVRPLTTATFRLDVWASGHDGIGPHGTQRLHLVNILLHAVCSVSVVLFISQLQNLFQIETHNHVISVGQQVREMAIPASIGMVFAVHAVHIEAIANISGRAELLACAFSLVSFATYIQFCIIQQQLVIHKSSNSRRMSMVGGSVCAGLLMLLACLSKESGSTVMAWLCLVHFALFVHNRDQVSGNINSSTRSSAQVKHSVKTMAFPFTVFLLFLGYRHIVTCGNSSPTIGFAENPAAFHPDFPARVASYMQYLKIYAYKAIWPTDLSPDYSVSAVELPSTPLSFILVPFYSMAAALCWAVHSLWKLRDRRYAAVAIVIACSSFIPASNLFFPVGTTVAERLLYLPVLAVAVLAVELPMVLLRGKLGDFFFVQGMHESGDERLQNKSRRLFALYAGLFLASAYVAIQWQLGSSQVMMWSNEHNLWDKCIESQPNSFKCKFNKAVALAGEGRQREACPFLEQALQLHPSDPSIYLALADAYAQSGQQHKAMEVRWNAASKFPCDARNQYFWAHALHQLHRVPQAIEGYNRVLEVKADHAVSYNNKGVLILELMRKEVSPFIDKWNQQCHHVNNGKEQEIVSGRVVCTGSVGSCGPFRCHSNSNEGMTEGKRLHGKFCGIMNRRRCHAVAFNWMHKKLTSVRNLFLNASKLDPSDPQTIRNLEHVFMDMQAVEPHARAHEAVLAGCPVTFEEKLEICAHMGLNVSAFLAVDTYSAVKAPAKQLNALVCTGQSISSGHNIGEHCVQLWRQAVDRHHGMLDAGALPCSLGQLMNVGEGLDEAFVQAILGSNHSSSSHGGVAVPPPPPPKGLKATFGTRMRKAKSSKKMQRKSGRTDIHESSKPTSLHIPTQDVTTSRSGEGKCVARPLHGTAELRLQRALNRDQVSVMHLSPSMSWIYLNPLSTARQFPSCAHLQALQGDCNQLGDAEIFGCWDSPRRTKRPGSIWVYMCMESAEFEPNVEDIQFLNQFDISATYRLDSTVPMTYVPGNVSRVINPIASPTDSERWGDAVFVASNCVHARDSQIAEIMQYMDIDSYGRCLKNKDWPAESHPVLGSHKLWLLSQYKVVFAFENSRAQDYVTEKFWQALMAGAVPVYWGAPNIQDLAPSKDCFVDVSQFSSLKQVAAHVQQLLEEPERLLQMHAWRSRMLSAGFLKAASFAANEGNIAYGEGVQHGLPQRIEVSRLCEQIAHEMSLSVDIKAKEKIQKIRNQQSVLAAKDLASVALSVSDLGDHGGCLWMLQQLLVQNSTSFKTGQCDNGMLHFASGICQLRFAKQSLVTQLQGKSKGAQKESDQVTLSQFEGLSKEQALQLDDEASAALSAAIRASIDGCTQAHSLLLFALSTLPFEKSEITMANNCLNLAMKAIRIKRMVERSSSPLSPDCIGVVNKLGAHIFPHGVLSGVSNVAPQFLTFFNQFDIQRGPDFQQSSLASYARLLKNRRRDIPFPSLLGTLVPSSDGLGKVPHTPAMTVVVPCHECIESIFTTLDSIQMSAERLCVRQKTVKTLRQHAESVRSELRRGTPPGWVDGSEFDLSEAKSMRCVEVVIVVDQDSGELQTASMPRNQTETLLSSVESAMQNSTRFANLMLHVVDGGSRLGAGRARNLGVDCAGAEIVCYLDADDRFTPRHLPMVAKTFNTDLAVGWVKSRLQIDKRVTAWWKEAIENSIPSNTCVRRHYHHFVGGFPESDLFFNDQEDLAYVQYLQAFFGLKFIEEENVEYVRRSGNRLDNQMAKFETEGPSKMPPNSMQETFLNQERRAFIQNHIQTLTQNMQK